mmetsp:Transcript_57337/g.174605  ORF Transcript_57337/g.174605 Transcript_57337/m.174605 type:complete len:468 (-) Transcript_57337:26-1429(-)
MAGPDGVPVGIGVFPRRELAQQPGLCLVAEGRHDAGPHVLPVAHQRAQHGQPCRRIWCAPAHVGIGRDRRRGRGRIHRHRVPHQPGPPFAQSQLDACRVRHAPGHAVEDHGRHQIHVRVAVSVLRRSRVHHSRARCFAESGRSFGLVAAGCDLGGGVVHLQVGPLEPKALCPRLRERRALWCHDGHVLGWSVLGVVGGQDLRLRLPQRAPGGAPREPRPRRCQRLAPGAAEASGQHDHRLFGRRCLGRGDLGQRNHLSGDPWGLAIRRHLWRGSNCYGRPSTVDQSFARGDLRCLGHVFLGDFRPPDVAFARGRPRGTDPPRDGSPEPAHVSASASEHQFHGKGRCLPEGSDSRRGPSGWRHACGTARRAHGAAQRSGSGRPALASVPSNRPLSIAFETSSVASVHPMRASSSGVRTALGAGIFAVAPLVKLVQEPVRARTLCTRPAWPFHWRSSRLSKSEQSALSD